MKPGLPIIRRSRHVAHSKDIGARLPGATTHHVLISDSAQFADNAQDGERADGFTEVISDCI